MRFLKIAIRKDGVELVRELVHANGDKQHIELEADGEPLPSFVDALQAFAPFVLDLLPIIVDPTVPLTVTTLNLSVDKNGLRGLIVTATVPVERAYDKPLVLNTPLVREAGENASDEACVLPDEVLALIGLVEGEATRYWNGERVQTEMFNREDAEQPATSDPSDNAAQFAERAAAASAASTRKPRRGKPKDFVPGVGPVVNPDATDVLTTDTLRQLLLSVERDVPVDAIARWTSSEREGAERWARMRQRELLRWQDNLYAIAVVLEDLRRAERYGVQSALLRAGFKALPAAGGTIATLSTVQAAELITRLAAPDQVSEDRERRAHEIMSVAATARDWIRVAVARTHPDVGGRNEDWTLLQEAARIITAHHGGKL